MNLDQLAAILQPRELELADELANQNLHELTHAGLRRNYDMLSPAQKALCKGAYDPKLVCPLHPPGTNDKPFTHPRDFSWDGINQHIAIGGGVPH